MEEFAKQFGLDWRLFISQAVNFFIVLIVLRYFLYKPIASILHERKRRIDEGLMKAEESNHRLEEAQEAAKERMKEAESEASTLLKEMEVRAKERSEQILDSSREKGEILLREAVRSIESERGKARKEVEKEAKELVRAALVHIAEMSPQAIDETLLDKTLQAISKRP